jgi:hypothetical protein
MPWKDIFTLMALLSALPGAWWSFKRAFYRDITEQAHAEMLAEQTVSWFYKKIMLRITVDQKATIDDLLEPTSSFYWRTLLSKDPHVALKIFLSFSLAFVFSVLALFSI